MILNFKNIFYSLPFTMVALIFASCGDKAVLDNTLAPAGDGARIRFHNAVPGGPAVVLYNGDTKVSASLTTVTYGPDSVASGGLFPALDYAVVPAGTVKYSIRPPSSSTITLQSDLNLTNGSYYSLIAYDTVGAQKFLLVNDDRTAVKDTSKAYVKIVNVVNGAPAGYDFYFKRQGIAANLVATVKGFDASSYIEIAPYPLTNTANDSLYVRPAGGTANVFSLSLGAGGAGSAAILQPNRIRNLIIRGVAASATTIKATGSGAVIYYIN